MRGGVGDVEEERLVRRGLRVLADEPDRVVADGVGVVIGFLRLILGVADAGDDFIVAHERAGVPETARAVEGAVEAVEAALERPVVARRIVLARDGRDVPFAYGVGAVAGGLHGLRDGDAALVQLVLVARPALLAVHHVADARLVRVKPGEQRGARGAAAGGVVELRKAQPARRERIEVRRGNLAPVAAEVGEAHVVGENVNDVRLRGSGGGGEAPNPKSQAPKKHPAPNPKPRLPGPGGNWSFEFGA